MDRDFDKKDGRYFPVMNELAEKLMTYQLTTIEHQVLWMFFRFCYGYNSSACELRWKDMLDYTGLPKGSLSKAINKLKNRNIIKSFQVETKTHPTYRINSKLSTWKAEVSKWKQFPNVNQKVSKREPNSSQMETLPIKNNIKTNKNNTRKSVTFESNSYPYLLAKTLLEQITLNLPDFKPSRNGVRDQTLQRWSADIDKMIRIDKRSVCAIWNMIIWCQADDFWFPNIQSGTKLRKQYDRLAAQINRAYRKNKTQHDKLLEVGERWLKKQT